LLRYALYHRSFDLVKRIGLKTADEGYEYPVAPAAEVATTKNAPPDARTHYALALRLTKKKKYGLVLRTIEFFEKSFKDSAFAADMAFLKANTLLRLADEMQSEKLKMQATDLLAATTTQEPRTDRGLKARLFLLKIAAGANQHARALDLAKTGVGLKDQNEPLYLLALAEAHLALGDLELAAHNYKALWDLGAKSDLAPEAAYRAGDVAILQGDFEKAEQQYVQALQGLPDKVNAYPTAVFNLAETYYRRGNLKDAREMFLEFKNRFPQDANLWAAELRIPEIDRQLGQNLPESTTRYLSVIDRHPYTTGAYIAEMRLADCAASAEDEKKTLFFESYFAKEPAEKHGHELVSQLELKRLTDLAFVRFSNGTEAYEAVLPYIDAYRDRVAEMDVGESFKAEFSRAAVNAVESMVEEGRYKDAIAADRQYGDFAGTPKPVPYEIALLSAQQRLGQLEGVETIANRLRGRMEGATREERDAFFVADHWRLKLLNTDVKDLSAVLHNISDGGAEAAYKYYELAELAVASKDFRLAVEYDSKLLEVPVRVKHLKPRQEITARLRLISSLIAIGDGATARKLSDRFLLTKGALTEYVDLQAKARELRAEALYRSGDFREALAVIDDVLKFSPEDSKQFIRKTEFEFLRAKCLDGLSRGKEAIDSYRKIAASDKGLWGKSAQAEIDHKEFKQPNQGMEKR
jgi:tetratricopeptide (TPR) repeat protein